jgi:O-methyltransferase
MYGKLSIGGYVIMDDWSWFPSRTAVEDFFKVHDIQEEIKDIDVSSAYWKKTKDVKVQYWRYEQSKFTG